MVQWLRGARCNPGDRLHQACLLDLHGAMEGNVMQNLRHQEKYYIESTIDKLDVFN